MSQYRLCRNEWKFEGTVHRAPEELPTRTGRQRAQIFLKDRPAIPGKRFSSVLLKALAFDQFAEELLVCEVGERLILSGNFSNPPPNSWHRGFCYCIVTGIRRVDPKGTTLINEWVFEGTVSAPPVRTAHLYGAEWGQISAWQTSVRFDKVAKRAVRTKPTILNTILAGNRLRGQLSRFEKGDDIEMSGRLMSGPMARIPRAQALRVNHIDRDVADVRQMRRTTDPFVSLEI